MHEKKGQVPQYPGSMSSSEWIVTEGGENLISQAALKGDARFSGRIHWNKNLKRLKISPNDQ